MGTKLSINGITFGDATVQNTAATTGVTSLTAGSGISVSAATGAVTVSATGGGVTSAVAGNGITVSGATGAVTFSQDIYTGTTRFNTSFPVGSYLIMFSNNVGDANATINNMRINTTYGYYQNGTAGSSSALSGTWRFRGFTAMDPCSNATGTALAQRVS